MNPITRWIPSESVGAGLAILSLAVTIGLAFGAIRVRGIRLGLSGVLFSALLFGQIGLSVDPKVLEFLRDFALIIFMYAIGLEVGPAFFSSLRSDGLRLNILTVVVLVLGALMTIAVSETLPRASAAGLYAGAFTTTPGLAAAQEALRRAPASAATTDTAAARMGLAYSITYPFGVVGPLLIIPLLQRLFKVRLKDETHALNLEQEKRHPPLAMVEFEVTPHDFIGKPLSELSQLRDQGIVFSRLLRRKSLSVPTADTRIEIGDIYRAVGPRQHLTELVSALGRPSTVDLDRADGDVQRIDLVVTRTQVLHRPLRDLDLIRRTGVTIARLDRAGVELVPTASLRLAFADRVTVVGPHAGLKLVEAELGNSPETLNRSQLIPIFLGIVLGVLVGSIPLKFPGMSTTLRIGLAGGPLLAAIALSQLGNLGAIVWYMPVAANQLFRDFGVAVFLACVGLQAGNQFIQRAWQGGGLTLLVWGAAITMVPVFLVACFARRAMRMNFITLTGWVAGAMGSSVALLFANELTDSDAPAVAFAAVAPVATLLPILICQVLAAIVP
jgi:putative transport protein